MRSPDRDDALLRYIQESIGRVEEYSTAGKQAFLGSAMIQDAILRRIGTLVDAASHLAGKSMQIHGALPLDSASTASFRTGN